MRTPGHENRGSLSSGGTGSSGGGAERLPSSPWTSLAATAAGDVAAGAAFSPAQAHQIAAATAAAVAAATAAAAAHPGHREPTVNTVFASRTMSFFRGDEIGGADKSAPTPAQTAVARAEVALLEAKMEALREQLECAAEASARMEARARAAAAAREGETLLSEGGEKKERGDKDDKAARGENVSPAETFEDDARLAEKGKAPVSSPDSRPASAIARVEEDVPSAGESESESSEEIRRRRVERFGDGSE